MEGFSLYMANITDEDGNTVRNPSLSGYERYSLDGQYVVLHDEIAAQSGLEPTDITEMPEPRMRLVKVGKAMQLQPVQEVATIEIARMALCTKSLVATAELMQTEEWKPTETE